jgi:hypothetical protein
VCERERERKKETEERKYVCVCVLALMRQFPIFLSELRRVKSVT